MIEFKNVTFEYETEEKTGIYNISFSLKQGECLLLCGESGSGKTTVTKLINGLIPNFEKGKMSGSINVCGLDPQTALQYELARHVACVFQNPKSQFFNTDVESELTFNLENFSVPVDEINEKLANAVKELRLEKLMKKSLFEMSGGEKQLIAFASAYISGAEIIVLDEPSANLDTEAIDKIRFIIKKMKQCGRTVIISEHRVSYLKDIADTVCYLKQGKIGEYLTAEEFYGMSDDKRIEMGLRSLKTDLQLRIKDRKESKNTVLKVENLDVGYKRHCVLEKLSFTCSEGEIIGIVGKNGLGKTTLLRTICGLQKEMGGSIVINGRKTGRRSRQTLCGLVMQDVNYQIFAESVEGECRLGNPGVSRDKVEDILSLLSLNRLKKRHPQSLSGGQKQRLAVAVSYLCDKKILLLDEPTSGLDYENMTAVSRLLKELSLRGILCIVVSHDIEFLNDCCTGILELDKITQNSGNVV